MPGTDAVQLRQSLHRQPAGGDSQFLEDIRYLERLRDSFTENGHLDRAIEIREKIKVLKASAVSQKVRVEEQRQDKEHKLLDAGLVEARKRLAAEWEIKIRDCDEDCDQKLMALKQVHERDMASLERELQKNGNPAIKYSKELLQLKISRDKLIKLERFEEVMMIERRVQEMEKRECVAHQVAVSEAARKRRVFLEQQQAQELVLLERTLNTRRLKARRERDNAFQLFEQTSANLKHDMKHAHTMEFHMKPQPAKSLNHARKSYATQSSTFRGTLLFSKHASAHITTPS
eukprot:TRINITY_DN15702_c0_g1_i1.p2 TRINITY_DN15702_c0_g1~~TRINITY_DN15702_c0_g1_i1.p2  ORF type:complete len:289 (-),score=53.01 TRINITY_DN15702_c0_g1_i1:1058-1924(-)